MSMIHSSIIPFDPLLTDVLLWTTERTCYACYTIRNYYQFYYKDNTTLVCKAKNCSTNFTITIKDYKTLVCKAITFVVSMAPLMLTMLDPDSTTNVKNVGPRPT